MEEASLKEICDSVNRKVNCETANLNKTECSSEINGRYQEDPADLIADLTNSGTAGGDCTGTSGLSRGNFKGIGNLS